MKRSFTKLLLCAGLLWTVSGNAKSLWTPVDVIDAPQKRQVMHPTNFLVYTLDETSLKYQLWNVSSNPSEGVIISLPLPDGSYRNFKVWESSLMPDVLAAKYPDIRS